MTTGIVTLISLTVVRLIVPVVVTLSLSVALSRWDARRFAF
jgi:hypothetical protein